MSLLSFYKKPQPRGYDTSDYLIEDVSETSPSYFNIQQFPSVVGGGKSVIVIKGNGENLRLNSTIDVEIKDANGDNMFVEMTNFIDRFNNYYLTFEVYDITAKGMATVYLVGEALYDIPAYQRQVDRLEGELQILVNELRVLQDRYNTTNNNLINLTTEQDLLRRFRDNISQAIVDFQRRVDQLSGQGQNNGERAQLIARIQQFSNELANSNLRLPTLIDKAAEEQRVLDRLSIQVQEAANRVERQQQVLSELEPTPLPKPPDSQRPLYNVRWSRSIMVLPSERNNAELFFDQPPSVGIVQVITPERALVSQSTGSQYLAFTSSATDFTIQQSNFQGYDRDFATSAEILDPRLSSILLNPTQKPSTTNTINTSQRMTVTDIQNGYLKEQSSRYGTTIISASGSIQKDFLGGVFNFFSSASVPTRLTPTPPANYTLSQSISQQLAGYSANIVEVISDSQMIVSEPLQVVMLDSNSKQNSYTTSFKYEQASRFTGSIAYLPSDGAFVTSSTVSQSYLEVTFLDMKPISGEVYRIKTYYKRGIATGEFTLIYDNVVTPVEYLTDAVYPNQTSYAKRESDYRLIGHFTSAEILTEYWDYFVETPTATYTALSPTIASSSLHESARLTADHLESTILTTKYNQNYNANQIYTLSMLVALDPNTELEIYMNSDPVSSNVVMSNLYPRAFSRTINKEKTRYRDSINRFGKYVGKIVNDSNKAKYYGRVEFDFITDADGLGRPLLRSNTVDRANVIGNAYVAEVSIKPLTMNGFSPNLVQFAIPFNNEIDSILALSQSLDFKIEYFDYTGKQSEYITNINDLVVNLKGEIPSNTCQTETTYFMLPGQYENY